MRIDYSEENRRALDYSARVIRPMLAGITPELQAVIIADLMATWLAGHQGPEPDVLEYREQAFQAWIALVRNLVPINEREILESLGVAP